MNEWWINSCGIRINGTVFGFLLTKIRSHVSNVVFSNSDCCNLLPFVYNKDNGRRYCEHQQESVEAITILGKRKRNKELKQEKGQKFVICYGTEKAPARTLDLFSLFSLFKRFA